MVSQHQPTHYFLHHQSSSTRTQHPPRDITVKVVGFVTAPLHEEQQEHKTKRTKQKEKIHCGDTLTKIKRTCLLGGACLTLLVLDLFEIYKRKKLRTVS